MKKIARLIGLVALTSLLAACHRGHDISIDGHSITMHAADVPAATITSTGSLSVGPKLIDVSPDQRQMLMHFYNGVVSIEKGSEAMKQAGLDMAGNALHAAGHSIANAVGVASDSSAAGKATTQAIQAKGDVMEKKALQLCARVQQIKSLQASMATQIPAFKPYAGLDPAPGVSCHGSVTTVGV